MGRFDNEDGSSINGFKIGAAVIIALVALISIFQMWESLDAHEIMVVQSPFNGELTWHLTPGVKSQNFGKVTKYPRRAIYEFAKDNGNAIRVGFNDNGHADITGSIQYELPLDVHFLTQMHLLFGSPENLQTQLIVKVVDKAIFLTGPIMSSKEAYAEKRNELIFLVEDQIINGIFKTSMRQEKQHDVMTRQEKTVLITEINKDIAGVPLRNEEGQLNRFGLKPFNFAIKTMDFDTAVENQIIYQQGLAMDIQSSIAEARKAEQNVITVAKTGEANAMTAKWEQEKINAKLIAEAEQRKTVAKLDMEAAEFTKQQLIKKAEGESEYKRKVMMADGALEQKLKAWQEVNYKYAEEFSKQKWVPEIDMSGSGGGKASGSGAQAMIDMLTVNTAKQLSLDMSMKGGK